MAARSGVRGLCASALVAGMTLPSGCVDDGVSAHVICAIPPTLEEDSCTFETNGDVCLLDGVLNLSATDRYYQVLRIESGLKPRVREVPPQGETNRISFNRAKIELRASTGERFLFEDLPNPYYVVAQGYVAPDGVGQASLTAITPAYATQLQRLFAADPPPASAQIVLSITVKGDTDGETSVTAGEFLWPVRVVRQSVNPVDNACLPIEFCQPLLGQDRYANACRP